MASFDVFLNSYVECLLWTAYGVVEGEDETVDGLDLHERGFDLDDFDAAAQKEIEDDCESFFEEAQSMIEGREAQAGHDFCLTRNRHGAGFWDGGWPRYGNALTKMSKPYGTQQAMAFLDEQGDVVDLTVHG